MKEINI